MIDIEVKHPTLNFSKHEVDQILAQFNRTVESAQIDVDCIKTWIGTQPHLTQMPSKLKKFFIFFLFFLKTIFEIFFF